MLQIKGKLKAKFGKEDQRKLSRAIKNIFGFYPENVFLYALALRHKSVAEEVHEGVKNSNERLEFLGDAILSAVVADYLFKIFPYKDEGFLTKMRSKMVSRAMLNKISSKMGIPEMVNSTKDKASQPKSINGDAFEALIGAIYLDQGYNFTRKLIINRIYKSSIDIEDLEKLETNFKSRLIEWAQKNKKVIEFKPNQSSPNKKGGLHYIDLILDGNVIATAKDFNIKGAEQSAAEKAWAILMEPSDKPEE